jgi:hypothetical protein
MDQKQPPQDDQQQPREPEASEEPRSGSPNVATNDDDGAESVGRADPGGGGCLKFGWGCLPLLAAVLLLPPWLMF